MATKEKLLPNDSALPVATPVPVAQAQPVVSMGMPVGAPDQMVMGRTSHHWRDTLVSTPGLLLRERISLMQWLFGACEKRTSYAVGPYPMAAGGADVTQLHNHLDDEAFKASLTNGLFEVREDSTCCCRYVCHQNRELKLGMFAPRNNIPGDALDLEMQGGIGGLKWPEDETPSLQFFRPFKCSCPCFCCMLHPQTIDAIDTASSASLGGTTMDWDCSLCALNFCALCCFHPRLRYVVADETGKPEYHVHVPGCCSSGCTNCCAPTCFNAVFTMPITSPGETTEIGSLQSHWPGCNVRGLCCAGNANNNYAVGFPLHASAEQKARLLSALHIIDLNLFEQRANQRN